MVISSQNGVSRGGDQLPLWGDMEVSVPCVHFALCRLNGEKAFSLDSEIQFIAGFFQIALGKIELAAAHDRVVVYRLIQARERRARGGCQKRAKRIVLSPISG